MTIVILMLRSYTAYMPLWKEMLQLSYGSDVIPMAMRLWTLEYIDPRLHFQNSPADDCLSSAALLHDLLHEMAGDSILDDIYANLDAQEAERIGSIALGHLRRTSSRGEPGSSIDISIIVSLSAYQPLHRILLCNGSVEAVTKGLFIDTCHSVWDAEDFDWDGRHGEECLRYLQRTLNEGNGFTWAIHALKFGILDAILCSSISSPDETMDIGLEMLSSTLPKYLIYESVLIEASHALRRAIRRNGDPNDDDIAVPQPMKNCWSTFEEYVWNGLCISGRSDETNPDVVLRRGCSFPDVSKVDYI